MRRLILHPGEKVLGPPDSRIQKFTRGPISSLKRPRPFSADILIIIDFNKNT